MKVNIDKSIRYFARKVLQMEKQTIEGLIQSLDAEYERIIQLLHDIPGKIIITGVGKSAIIGQKIVATLNSTGTVSVFLHAGDAIHGDLGLVEEGDIILCISKSGNTPEIKTILTIIQSFGNKTIAMTANRDSFLARKADFLLWTPVAQEADPHNLAPTCSTIAQLAMGDAVALSLSRLKKFEKKDFARFHPGGMLGKSLNTRVSHLLHLHEKPVVRPEDTIEKVILEMTEKRLGATAVLDDKEEIAGIITDGDLRRMLMKTHFSPTLRACDIMTVNPISVDAGCLAVSAIDLIQNHSITQLIVTENGRYAGMIHLHDLLNEGFTKG